MSAEKAKQKAFAGGFDQPLSFWQEFMSQSLGWSSFHHAGQMLKDAEQESQPFSNILKVEHILTPSALKVLQANIGYELLTSVDFDQQRGSFETVET